MDRILMTLKIGVFGTLALLGSQAWAQAGAVASEAAPAISGMAKAIEAITVTKMATDTVQSIATAAGTSSSKSIPSSLNGVGDPKIFYASYLPSDAKDSIELTEGWKSRELQCEMHYLDPNFGNAVANWKIGPVALGGVWPLKDVWPQAAVSFYYTIDFQYNGSYKGHGQYINDLALREQGQRTSSGWHFTVTPAKLPAEQMGTVDDPLIAFTVDLKFAVQNEALGVTLVNDEHEDVSTFYGDGRISHPKQSSASAAQGSRFVTKCTLLSDQHLQDETELYQPE